MLVGYVQNSPIFGDKSANFDQVNKLVGNSKADLLVLPELFATGYTFTSKLEAMNLAEEVGGETSDFLKGISKQTGSVIVAGFAEKDEEQIYNSAIMVYQEQTIAVYRKIHLFNREKLWFAPGNRPLEVYEVCGMKIGMMICFDWVFPEVARTLALNGAQIIAHPANLVLPYCQKAMVTRCLENRIFAITANRVGGERREDDDFNFTGGSQITSVNGAVLSSASKEKPFVDIKEVDLSKAISKRVNPHNDLFQDRRVEFYYSK